MKTNTMATKIHIDPEGDNPPSISAPASEAPRHKVHCGCGQMHVKKASLFIGLFTILGGSFNMINTAINASLPGSMRLGMGVYNAVLIIFGCLLIAGVRKQKHHFLTPFIVLMYALIVTSVVMLVLSVLGQFYIDTVVRVTHKPEFDHYLDDDEERTKARIGLALMTLAFIILLLIPMWYLDIVKKCYLYLKHHTLLDHAEAHDEKEEEMKKY